MKVLNYYAQLLQDGQIKTTDNKIVRPNACSLRGFALELACKDYYHLPLKISAAGANDLIIKVNGKRRFIEIKSNGSPIGTVGRSSLMCYAFMVDLNKTIAEQYGYIMDMKTFLQIGEKHHHIRHNATVAGGKTVAELKTQSVYNYTKSAPIGSKMYKLEDDYLEAQAMSFSEWFT